MSARGHSAYNYFVEWFIKDRNFEHLLPTIANCDNKEALVYAGKVWKEEPGYQPIPAFRPEWERMKREWKSRAERAKADVNNNSNNNNISPSKETKKRKGDESKNDAKPKKQSKSGSLEQFTKEQLAAMIPKEDIVKLLPKVFSNSSALGTKNQLVSFAESIGCKSVKSLNKKQLQKEIGDKLKEK